MSTGRFSAIVLTGCVKVFNELNYELTDVRCALKALERRVDTIEKLALKAQSEESAKDTEDGSNSPFAAHQPIAITAEHFAPAPAPAQEPEYFAPASASTPDLEPAPDLGKISFQNITDASHLKKLNRNSADNSASRPVYTSSSTLRKLLADQPARQTKSLETDFPGSADIPSAQAISGNAFSSNASTEDEQTPKEGIEVFIGRHLNKLGISFLVIGCALALIYQFQYFSPLLKIISGVIGGILLIVGGERFEKDNTKLAWYGRALIGGGWALSYFSVFAAHHFASVRVIENATIDVGLLLMVASGAVFHSLKYKSETITGISLTLAFLTICLSPATSFSLLSCALLVAALVGLTLKMGWFNLFVYGEFLLYGVYLGFILPQIMSGRNAIFGMNIVDGNFFTAAAFSTFCWMALNLVIFSTREFSPAELKKLVVATLLNSAAFVPVVLNLMSETHPDWKFGFLLSAGFAYLVSTMTGSKLTAPAPTTVHRILGLSLVTMAIPLKLTDDWGISFWSLEVPVLVWAGWNYQMPSLRRFAATLACIATLVLFISTAFSSHAWSHVIADFIAITAYGASAAIYLRAHNDRLSSKAGFYFYVALVALVAIILTDVYAPPAWLTLAYVFSSALIVFLGFKLKDQILRVTGALGIFLIGMPLFVSSLNVSSRLSTALIVPIMLSLSYLYHQTEKDGKTPPLQLLYQSAAAAVFTVLLGQYFHGVAFELALAVETLAILGLGFYFRNYSFKCVALLLSSFIAVKFATVDLANTASVPFFLPADVRMTLVLGIIASVTLSITSAMYLSRRLRYLIGETSLTAYYMHGALTGLVVGLLTISQAPKEYLGLFLSLECMVPLLIGIRYQLPEMRGIAHVGIFASQVVCLTLALNHWNIIATVFLIVQQYALSALFTRLKNDDRYHNEHSIEHYYAVLGTVTTSLLLFQEIPSHLLSIALTLQGVSVLGMGFNQKNKVLRVSGLVILGFVIARLLFVELASIETIYRILSFIGAGIVLLVASLAYARMSEPLEHKNS